MILNLF